MFLRLVSFVLAATLCFAKPAMAVDYADPTWQNLTRALVRFNALPIMDPQIIDEYSIITECDLYNAFYKNDFKWNEVRHAVLESIHNNAATFPTKFHYDVRLQLDRYDFERKIFRLDSKTALQNINSFVLFSVVGDSCGGATVEYMPRTFRAVLETPLYLEGLPLGENDAHALLKQMDDEKNADRYIHARFNLSIVYIEPLHKTMLHTGSSTLTYYAQPSTNLPRNVRFDVRLDSIDFYEDTHLTRLIYQYDPNGQ